MAGFSSPGVHHGHVATALRSRRSLRKILPIKLVVSIIYMEELTYISEWMSFVVDEKGDDVDEHNENGGLHNFPDQQLVFDGIASSR